MTKKLYGNLNNRLEENQNYTGRELQVGDDITMYFWSDRTCYYITRVVNQKHIFVKEYAICADQEKGHVGMGHQNWKFFKTEKERCEYLNKFYKKEEQYDLTNIHEESEQEWVLRYGKWQQVYRKGILGKPLEKPIYKKLQPISFGVRNYYFDWEF